MDLYARPKPHRPYRLSAHTRAGDLLPSHKPAPAILSQDSLAFGALATPTVPWQLVEYFPCPIKVFA